MRMRDIMQLVEDRLVEDQPRRLTDPVVVEWLEAAYQRPDVDELYLHGSRALFDRFRQPDLDSGHLIFASKLKDYHTRSGQTLQAEYYGPVLYLIKIEAKKPYNPYSDPKAKAIHTEALKGVWDYESKVQYGRLDYQDCDRVIPPAVAAGYNFFRVYEMSIRAESYAAAYPEMITIIDRYPGDLP